jgi:hypothetical protein
LPQLKQFVAKDGGKWHYRHEKMLLVTLLLRARETGIIRLMGRRFVVRRHPYHFA